MTTPNQQLIQVAIGLIFHHSQLLVGWRTAEQHQGNRHEFPGGKVEQAETPLQACRREIREEVGVDIAQWYEFELIQHDYVDCCVELHFFTAHLDTVQAQSIQAPWHWCPLSGLLDLNFPAANQSIVERLYWPTRIKVSTDFPRAGYFSALQDKSIQQLLYWRIDTQALAQDFKTTAAYQQLLSAQPEQLQHLIINIELFQHLPETLQQHIAAVHYKHHQLLALATLDKPSRQRCIAACHDLASIQLAQEKGMDAILLSPVLETASHPNAPYLGWTAFEALVAQCHVPVFALGGVGPNDLTQVQSCGGYGVAGITQF